MVGDWRWLHNKLNPVLKKDKERTVYPYIFSVDEIYTFSKAERCRLTVCAEKLTIDNKTEIYFDNILDIQGVDTLPNVSNKGLVIKVIFENDEAICFSFGKPELFTRLISANKLNGKLLLGLLVERWHFKNTSK